MATSSKRLAITNLVTTLEGITTGNGYSNTVGSVALESIDWHTARQDYTLPAIGIVMGEVTVEHQPSQCMRCTLPIQLEVVAAGTTKALVYDQLESLIDDIIGAIHVDSSRGDNVTGTYYDGEQTDESDPDWMDSHHGTAMAIIKIRLIWHRSISLTA